MSDFHLICVHPFHDIKKGDRISDPDRVAEFMKDRDHHFVRVAAPVVDVPMLAPSAPVA